MVVDDLVTQEARASAAMKRRHKRLSQSTNQLKPLVRTKYKQGSVQEACEEADQLLEMLPESRISKLVFKFEPRTGFSSNEPSSLKPKKPAWQEIQDKALQARQNKSLQKKSKCKGPKKYSWRTYPYSPVPSPVHRTHHPLSPPKCKKVKTNEDKTPWEIIKTRLLQPRKQKAVCLVSGQSKSQNERNRYMSVEDLTAKKSVQSPAMSPSSYTFEGSQEKVQKSPIPFSPSSDVSKKRRVLREQLQGSKLSGRTKEEKYQLDVEMYQKNEKAFEHDVNRFMIRNNRRIHRLPVWQNMPITLFQLFLAVYERGGFHEISHQPRGWDSIYRELSGTNRGNGNVAKKYYEKNLLPYELYISGFDYQSLWNQEKAKQKENQTKVKQKRRKHPHPEEKLQTKPGHVDGRLSTADLHEINRMLDHLNQPNTAGSPAMEVKFYNDSPRVQKSLLLNTAAPPQDLQPGSPAAGVQEVPCGIPATSGESASEGERVLHEMEALQQELDMLQEYL